MRLGRVVAAAAVVGWSKAAVAAPAVSTVTQPAAAAPVAPVAKPFVLPPTTCAENFKGGPFRTENPPPGTFIGHFVVEVDDSFSNCAGTLFLQASHDHTHWKNVKSAPVTADTSSVASAWAGCLPGTWDYRGLFLGNHQAFKSSTAQFTLGTNGCQ
jgi:hypothetical protein